MTMRNYDVPKLLKWVTALIAGLKLGGPGGLTSLAVGGTVYTVADLITKLTSLQAILSAVVSAEEAMATAVQGLNDNGDAVETFIEQTRTSVKGSLGKKSASLSTYGLAADKDPTPLTADQEVLKVARAKATRAARNTLGPKQKAKIKGQVPATPAAPTPATPALTKPTT